MSSKYDVIVIGLGAMGSAALYQLAKRGAKVLGIDQYEPPHTLGSTHGESRITRLAVGEGAAYIPLVRRSHEIWRELEAATGVKLLHQCGGYVICPKDNSADWHGNGDFVSNTARLAAEYGIAHERLSSAEMQARQPLLKLTDNLHAVYEPTGGIVSPELAVQTQLAEAQRLGANIRFNERVIGLSPQRNAEFVLTGPGTYAAEKVVLATGPWIHDLCHPPVTGYGFASGVSPNRTYTALTISLNPDKLFGVYRQVFYWFEVEDLSQFDVTRFPWFIWIGNREEDFYSVFPTMEGMNRGVKMVTEEFIETTNPTTVDRSVHQHEIDHMYNHFIKQRIDGISERCIGAEVCLYTVTQDEHFLIDYGRDGRTLVVSACSGHGFKHSAAIGEAVAQLVVDGESEIDLSGFGFGRFQM